MAFSVSYSFIAINQFSGVAKKIKKSADAIKNSIKPIGKELKQFKSISKNVSKSVSTSIKVAGADFSNFSNTSVRSTSRIKRALKATARVSKSSFRKMSSAGKRSLNALGRSISRVITKLRKLKRTSKGAGAGIAGSLKGLVVGAGLFLGLKKAISVGADFQDSLADLSAITGATGKDLASLSDETLRLAKASATAQTEVAGAIKIVASQKAELLKNIPALIGVTEQVLLLKNAAGIELAEAAEIVTQSLNIFGAEADQTARFVNVLAAGAKFGASEIGDTGRAVVLAGAKAREAGIGFEDLNAIIQVTAKGGFKGAQAGTALSAIIGKLTRRGTDFRKSGIAGAFQAIKDEIDATIDPTERALLVAKIFGEEHDKVGLSILNNIGLLDSMKKSITGTSVAQEQAKKRLSTFNAKMRKLGIIIKDKIIRLFNRLAPVLTKLAIQFGKFIDRISPEQIEKFGEKLKVFIQDAVIIGKQIGLAFKDAFSKDSITEFKSGLSEITTVLGVIIDAGRIISSVFKGVGTSIGETAAALETGDFSQRTPLAQKFAVGGKLFGVIEASALEKFALETPKITEGFSPFKLIARLVAFKTAQSLKEVAKPVSVVTSKISKVIPDNVIDFVKIAKIKIPTVETPLAAKLPSAQVIQLLPPAPPPTVAAAQESKATVDITIQAPRGVVTDIKTNGGTSKKLNVGVNMKETG